MIQKVLAILLALVIFFPQVSAAAQQAAKVPKIALVVNTPEADLVGPVPRGRGPRAFLEGLRDLGWVDGQNIHIERRSTEGSPDRGQPLLQEIVRLRVDAIVAVGGATVRAAKQATATIPIVMAGATLPVESGLIKSLARPGGNITGLTFEASGELDGKRLQLLKEVAPQSSRVAVIGTSRGRFWRGRAETEPAARAVGLTLRLVTVDAPQEFEKAFATIARERPDAIFVDVRPVNAGHKRLLVDFVGRPRRPAVYYGRDFVEPGGLMAYGPDLADLLRRAATYVQKILKGAKPADLPVEQPSKFELVINIEVHSVRLWGMTAAGRFLSPPVSGWRTRYPLGPIGGDRPR